MSDADYKLVMRKVRITLAGLGIQTGATMGPSIGCSP